MPPRKNITEEFLNQSLDKLKTSLTTSITDEINHSIDIQTCINIINKIVENPINSSEIDACHRLQYCYKVS